MNPKLLSLALTGLVAASVVGCHTNPPLPTYPPDANAIYQGAPGDKAYPEFPPADADRLTYGGKLWVDRAAKPVDISWNKPAEQVEMTAADTDMEPGEDAAPAAADQPPAEGEAAESSESAEPAAEGEEQ